jgi:hypothetical protein
MGGRGSGRKPSPCGTPAKYNWHRRRGEDCTVCKNAKTVYYRERRGSKPAVRRPWTPAENKRRVNQLLLNHKLTTGRCLDCGLKCDETNWFVFDLDHRDPSLKEFTIGNRKHDVSISRLMNEIAKCDLVCANCHRHRTFRQLKAGVVSPYNHVDKDVPRLFDVR